MEKDPLFQALTRPVLMWGADYRYCIFAVGLVLIAFLAAGSLVMFALYLPLHLFGILAAQRDPQFFELWLAKLKYTPRVPDGADWGCKTYRP